MAKVKKTRTRRTPEQRAKILATAQKEGLTAKDVQKRFGVAPITYYSWRKKAGSARAGRRRTVARASRNGGLGGRVRQAVEARMSKLLPSIVEAEVSRYLDKALGSKK